MTASRQSLPETALYAPVRDWLERAGWTVRAEVKNCDVAARKGDDLVVVELKRTVGIRLLEQALDRQRITPTVYVAVPRHALPKKRRAVARLFRLLRRLELGLLSVDLSYDPPRLEVHFHPLSCKPRRQKRRRTAVIEEIAGRAANLNTGGSNSRKRFTAYRQEALHIACCLEKFGNLPPRVCRKLGTATHTGRILITNHYGWFDRVDHGVYALNATGRTALKTWSSAAEPLAASLPASLEDTGITRNW
ncbi:MAG: hypothetical protein K8R90_08160 [Candidatus Cloacimonetes bacterium]|nr:hypothetical protein [Candidatus Cloacimonadota bacterium]